MKKNYKLQITNYKQCTCLKKGRCNYNVQNYKQKNQRQSWIAQGSFKLQAMTALIKSFCGGVQGGQFFQKAPPLAAEGNNENGGKHVIYR
jgi:hypothetical protein